MGSESKGASAMTCEQVWAMPGSSENLTQVTVSGNAMLPLYRHGDILLVNRDAPAAIGDRVVVESRSSGWIGGTLVRRGKDATVMLRGGNVSKDVAIPGEEIAFFGRIVWASQ